MFQIIALSATILITLTHLWLSWNNKLRFTKHDGNHDEIDYVDPVIASVYQTSNQVDTIVTNKGYQTASQVDTIVTNKGYQTANQVDTIVTNKGYQDSKSS